MSLAFMAAAWTSGLPPLDRLVLLALADWADQSGKCWPSIPQLAEKTGAHERTVRLAIGRLAGGGFLDRQSIVGKGTRYRLTREAVPTPGVAPTPGVTPTPGGEPTPGAAPATPGAAPANTSAIRQQRKKTSSSPSPARREAGSTGTRLAPEFVAPPDWIAWAAAERGWSAGDATAEADEFRDYWIAQPGAKGRKADWPATWRNWVRRSRRTPSSSGGQHGQRTDRMGGRGGAGYVRDRPVDGFAAALREMQAGGGTDHDRRG